MSNREPSLIRRIYPALALTGVGFGLINVLDHPSPATSLSSGLLAPDQSAAGSADAAAAAGATTVPAPPNSVAAQGQGATPAAPATAAPATTAAPAAPASTAAPDTSVVQVPVQTAPAAAPAANDCGAIEKTGATSRIALRREYGTLQVVAKFTSDKILCSSTAHYSVYESKSTRYNDYAIPILNKQASSAHSANIQGVSGATATSNAYANSLQSAIDQL